MNGHLHYEYLLICGHKVICGCGHKIGKGAWCIACQDWQEVREIHVITSPSIMINKGEMPVET